MKRYKVYYYTNHSVGDKVVEAISKDKAMRMVELIVPDATTTHAKLC